MADLASPVELLWDVTSGTLVAQLEPHLKTGAGRARGSPSARTATAPRSADSVSIVDRETWTVIGTVAVGDAPGAFGPFIE